MIPVSCAFWLYTYEQTVLYFMENEWFKTPFQLLECRNIRFQARNSVEGFEEVRLALNVHVKNEIHTKPSSIIFLRDELHQP